MLGNLGAEYGVGAGVALRSRLTLLPCTWRGPQWKSSPQGTHAASWGPYESLGQLSLRGVSPKGSHRGKVNGEPIHRASRENPHVRLDPPLHADGFYFICVQAYGQYALKVKAQ